MQMADVQTSWVSGRESGDDGTSSHLQTSDTNDGFFHRPVRIAAFPWNVNEDLYYEFNPWKLFCEDPRVINRLAHFRNLKMNLHVQVLINGNPFYYGRAIMNYIPLPNVDEFTTFRGGQRSDLIEATQRPHIFLDPCLCEGGELVLPFCFPKSAMSIPNSDWRQMGIIQLRSINGLQHANGSTDPVNITVLAFASELELNTPTSRTPVKMQPQSGSEYGNISMPASLIAGMAGALRNAPMIGPFARATEMIFKTVKDVAILFGYSRPRIVPEQFPLVTLYGDPAVVNFPDGSKSMALDAKKEITVDPRVVGMSPHDEMDILSIATRECYIDSFAWSENDPSTTHLYTFDVCPVTGAVDSVGAAHITPAAFVTLPFEYWKGSIEVRLQVVASAYHRGRIRAVWDPDFVVNSNNFNVNYSMLMDITESTETTFKIGWGQEYDYLRVPEVFSTLDALPRSTENRVKKPYANGKLSFYVVNPLTSPAQDKSVISVNVFVRACDDFEVASPTDFNMREFRVAKYALRPPDGEDTTAARAVQALHAIYSRGTSALQAQGNPYDGSEYVQATAPQKSIYYQAYSSTNRKVPVTLSFSEAGLGSSVTVKIQGQEKTIFPTAGVGTMDVDLTLAPGWNQIEMTQSADFTGAKLSTISTYWPPDVTERVRFPADLVKAGETTVSQYAGAGNTKFLTNVPGKDSIRILLPGWVPGTLVNALVTRECNITGCLQTGSIGSSTTVSPLNARVYTCAPDSTGYITISKNAGGITPWVMELLSLTYIYDINFVPQSGLEDGNAESDEANAPESQTVDVTMGPTSDVRGLNDIYFGEKVASLRQLMKRFTTCYFFDVPDGTTPGSYVSTQLHHYPTVVVQKLQSGQPGGTSYTTNPSIFSYFSSAFVCMRGGMRVKLLSSKPNSTAPGGYVHTLSRNLYGSPPLSINIDSEAGPSFRYKYMRWGGTAVDCTLNKPYVEFELPYYSNLRFTPARSTLQTRSIDYVERAQYTWEPAILTQNNLFTFNYAVAEDFSLSFFLCTPTLLRA